MEKNQILEQMISESPNHQYYYNNNLLMKKFYLIKMDFLRYILKLYESKNAELIILFHFYDTNDNTIIFAEKYTLDKLKKVHKIFRMFYNISDAIDELISILNENYPDNIKIKVKEFSYDKIEILCPFQFLKKTKKDIICLELKNIGINKPSINEYILNEIYNLKEKRIQNIS